MNTKLLAVVTPPPAIHRFYFCCFLLSTIRRLFLPLVILYWSTYFSTAPQFSSCNFSRLIFSDSFWLFGGCSCGIDCLSRYRVILFVVGGFFLNLHGFHFTCYFIGCVSSFLIYAKLSLAVSVMSSQIWMGTWLDFSPCLQLEL